MSAALRFLCLQSIKRDVSSIIFMNNSTLEKNSQTKSNEVGEINREFFVKND